MVDTQGSQSDTTAFPSLDLAQLPPEVLALVNRELPEYSRIVADLEKRLADVQVKTKSIDAKFSTTPTTNSLSLLQVKLHTHLSYLSHLLLYTLIRLTGNSLPDDPALERLVELKTVLEKMRPLENRVAYRISKLAAKQDTPGATEGTDDVRAGADIARDPLRFAPRPAALAGEDDSSSSDEDDGASASAGEATVKPKSKSKSKLSSSKKQKSSASDDADEVITASKASTLPYRPPRFAPTVLASTTAKPSRRGTDGTGRGASLAASRSRILRDLQAQFGDAPEDLSADGTGWGPRGEAEMTEAERFIKEKEKFEEEHFVRLPTSRKERKARMELAKMAGVWRGRDELESLDDFSTLSKLDSRVRRLNAMEHGTGALGRSRKRTLAASSEPSSKRARTMAGEEIVAEAARTGASVRRELTREKKKVKKLVKRKEKREKRREAKGAAA